jgi:hypothetical protein
MQEPRFLTNDRGKPVEVVLDLNTYRNLVESQPRDPKLLRDLSQEQLEALAEGHLTTEREATLHDLIEKKKVAALAPEESALLSSLLEQVDQLALLKARAVYTLHHLKKL